MNDFGEIQIVACFARRPKTNSISSNKTIITFRNSIFEQTDFLNKFNIPVIAGTPLGTSIEKIGFGSTCQWFQIEPNINNGYIEYTFINEIIDSKYKINGVRLLDDAQINQVLSSAPKYNWQAILDLLQNWNTSYTNHYFMYQSRNIFNSVSGLKPLFIAYQVK